jgi:hypothetical protein
LSEIFDIASSWKAVLLLDEADVFVEQRSLSEASRNALVCVLLRSLEYYEGILFLTTNRVKTIDEAIASRIHLPLRYVDLNQSARKEVWQSFLKTASAAQSVTPLTNKDFGRLAEKVLNGRQVRDPHSDEAMLIRPLFRSKTLFRLRELWRTMSKVQFACHTSRRLSISTSSSNWISVEPVNLRACIHMCEWTQWLIDLRVHTSGGSLRVLEPTWH